VKVIFSGQKEIGSQGFISILYSIVVLLTGHPNLI